MQLRFGSDGLLPCVCQDRLTGEVRMVAWMNRETLARTLATGEAVFFSRSRGEPWVKGATSGNRLVVRTVGTDCDADVLLLGVDPEGPSCHTGAPSCFFRSVDAEGASEGGWAAQPVLVSLERTLEARASAPAERSYTRTLLDGGPAAAAAKVREEAEEFGRALEAEDDARVVSEAADLVFHALVALRCRGLGLRSVLEELSRRQGKSGHREKAERGTAGPR